MTSPDLPTPVTLTLHAVNENELIDAMIAQMRVNVPAWVPQEGATEIVLFESLALVVGQQVYALNQLPRVVMDGIIAIRGYRRTGAVPAAGQVQVTLAATTIGTQTLPVGARFRIVKPGGGTFDVVAAESTSLNPADSLTGAVNVVAAIPGAAPNGTPIATVAVMVDTFTWITSAVVSVALTGGADTEADTLFYARVAAAFQAESATMVTDEQYALGALSVPGVGRAKAVDRWDGVGAAGTMGGHIAVFIAAPDGSVCTPTVVAAVLLALQTGGVAGLLIHLLNFTYVTMNLSITYVLAAGYVASVVTPAIEAALRAWLNPASWPLGNTLTSTNQVILRIGSVAGVSNVTAVTGLVTFAAVNSLPALGTVTITVT